MHMLIQFVLKTMLFLAINVTQGTPWDQKKSWLLIKKKFWFGLIWVHFPKIDLWGLFFTQILVPNPVVQSEKRYNEKCRFFQKLRKVAINQSFFFIILPANQLPLFWHHCSYLIWWLQCIQVHKKVFENHQKLILKSNNFNGVNLFFIT